MSRPAKFSHSDIVDATARLAARDGPARATMASIAAELGAPTGSLYHRFASRDILLGEVWLRAAQAFQDGHIALLGAGAPESAGLAAALYVAARVRREPAEGRILLLHRREDFLGGAWPVEMAQRAAELRRSGETALQSFALDLCGRADESTLDSVRFAVVGAPLAAVLPHLRADVAPPPGVDVLISATYAAVVRLLGTPASEPTTRS